jgi:hypothetical protein
VLNLTKIDNVEQKALDAKFWLGTMHGDGGRAHIEFLYLYDLFGSCEVVVNLGSMPNIIISHSIFNPKHTRGFLAYPI